MVTLHIQISSHKQSSIPSVLNPILTLCLFFKKGSYFVGSLHKNFTLIRLYLEKNLWKWFWKECHRVLQTPLLPLWQKLQVALHDVLPVVNKNRCPTVAGTRKNNMAEIQVWDPRTNNNKFGKYGTWWRREYPSTKPGTGSYCEASSSWGNFLMKGSVNSFYFRQTRLELTHFRKRTFFLACSAQLL